ncbi:MAG: hypothetical protein KIT84_03660 [Labilithrix sp.]|nr:hypothetical protein [Labilithrix sp.]MCW5810080.1 hypothetical protein [Labilithrix sp.]
MKTSKMHSTLKIAAAFAFTLLAACHGGRLETPNGFATLGSNDAYSYRATDAKGVVLAVRTESNDVKGNVDFWADLVDVRLREKGYAFESSEPAHTKAGLGGRQLRYLVERDGRTQRYWVTVFATKKKVVLVEAGGDKEAFDGATAMVTSAIETLEL